MELKIGDIVLYTNTSEEIKEGIVEFIEQKSCVASSYLYGIRLLDKTLVLAKKENLKIKQ